jgi:phosphoserine phosphatase
MNLYSWLILAINFIGLAITVATLVRKQDTDRLKMEADTDKRLALLKDHQESEIKAVREKVERCEMDFHQHEIANDRQFEKYHTDTNDKLDKIFDKIDKLKDIVYNMALSQNLKKNEIPNP